jgi:hypothetical protein
MLWEVRLQGLGSLIDGRQSPEYEHKPYSKPARVRV